MQKKCLNQWVTFDKRTIVVTAFTGAAAVSIDGETTAEAFALNREVRYELDEFRNTFLFFVDEISFASVQDIESLNQKLRAILDNPIEPFGGEPIVFSGNFTLGGVRFYKFDSSFVWKEFINLFMELKNNHRFDRDPQWGKLLGRFHKLGPSTEDVAIINTRVVGAANGPLEIRILSDTVYATKTNVKC